MGEPATQQTGAAYRDPPPFEVQAQGQSLTFYPAGKDRREAMLELVREARTSLDVCFYIFAEDGSRPSCAMPCAKRPRAG